MRPGMAPILRARDPATRFVAHATQRHSFKLPAQRARNQIGPASLADSWRSDKQQDRALCVRPQFDDGQKLKIRSLTSSSRSDLRQECVAPRSIQAYLPTTSNTGVLK